MNNLQQRVLTAIVLTAVIIVAASVSAYTFIILILAINVLALLEFYRLFHKESILPRKIAGILLSLFIIISITLIINGFLDWRIALGVCSVHLLLFNTIQV